MRSYCPAWVWLRPGLDKTGIPGPHFVSLQEGRSRNISLGFGRVLEDLWGQQLRRD